MRRVAHTDHGSCRMLISAGGVSGRRGENPSGTWSRGSDYQRGPATYPAAIIEYKNVLQIDPNNAAAHWGLAKAYLSDQQTSGRDSGNSAKPCAWIRTTYEARAQLSQLLLLLAGDPDEALVQADELISRGGERGHLLRAQALDRLERIDEAFEEYELAIAEKPDETAPVAMYAQVPESTRKSRGRGSPTSIGNWSRWSPASPAQTSLAAFLRAGPRPR